MKRERFSSRLGFILICAACAIGLGNVWRFPYIVGRYGGGAFVLIYLVFLVLLGLPIMTMELAVGRGSQKSAASSFDALEPAGSKWHNFRYLAIAGNYLLMMFYTTICGWMFAYFYKMVTWEFKGLNPDGVANVFGEMVANPTYMIFWLVVTIVGGLFIVSLGLNKGLERYTKSMMIMLLLIMIGLVLRSVTLPGAKEGLLFYLKPDLSSIREAGLWEVIYAAMGQAFFTLSIGMGSIAIFGSYIGKERSLTGEAISIITLDTFVALMAGMIIFPATSAFGIEVGQGPGLIFVTLPNVFVNMSGGRFFGSFFFLFMSFAAFSTVLAVLENIVAFAMDLWNWSRKKAFLFNAPLLILLSLPTILGFNVWESFAPLGPGTIILDLEDFIVSNNILPIGGLIYVLFCTRSRGWGWENFLSEANTGSGVKFPRAAFFYVKWILPLIILVVFIAGYLEKFFL
ncbi:MAG TPA: sodium-dependent transporter [Clostridia bacterium]|nr:sodium-dependent transporter [Clostridia bacterium]